MASSTIRKKTPCAKCNKGAGIFTCRGCGKDFCYRHVAEHRQELNKCMDEVATNHDQLQQTIAEQGAQPNCHPLMKKIDAWEQQSINKIQQAAINARKELLTVLGSHITKVTNDLTHVTQELNKARNEDDYVETDLQEWIEKLDKLNKDLNATQTIDFGQDDNGSALISKIFINGVSTDFFEKTIGDIQIIENGKVVVHGQTHQNAAVRGRGEYSSGQHRFRFKMEQNSGNGGFSFGIVSKTTPVESLLNITAHHNMYGYGYRDSQNYNGYNNNGLFYFTDYNRNSQTNDIIELFLDCDQHMIHLTNEGTRQNQILQVNMTTCPFPWQFFVTLIYANDRVRLCEENASRLIVRSLHETNGNELPDDKSQPLFNSDKRVLSSDLSSSPSVRKRRRLSTDDEVISSEQYEQIHSDDDHDDDEDIF